MNLEHEGIATCVVKKYVGLALAISKSVWEDSLSKQSMTRFPLV